MTEEYLFSYIVYDRDVGLKIHWSLLITCYLLLFKHPTNPNYLQIVQMFQNFASKQI